MIFSYILMSKLLKPRRISLEEAERCEREKGYWGNFSDFLISEYLVKLRDGYEIHTFLIPAEEESKKYVIITHGYTYNRYGSVKYVHLFRRLGYNCIIYDNRAHGVNGEAICTMGIEESEDLKEMVADAYKRYGSDIYLGLHGESLGAALTCMALGKGIDVRFAVVDCAYSNLEVLAKEKVRDVFHMPAFLIWPAAFVGKVVYKFHLEDVVPAKALANNQVPVCFIHGEADGLIDCHHSKELQQANAGYSELHLFPGADHAESLNSDVNRYFAVVREFLEKI